MRNNKIFRELGQRHAVRLLALIFTLFGVGDFLFAATPANTQIQNSASVTYTVGTLQESKDSNIESFFVDELIAFTLVSNNPAGVNVSTPQSGRVLSYTLTSQGNGSESFTISFAQSGADDFNVANPAIYLDANDNGVYESGTDTLYAPGANDPTLTEGTSQNIFIVADIPSSQSATNESKIDLIATSNTGGGAAGSIYNGAGDGGVDATIGLQGGTISAEGKFQIGAALATLTKSQNVVDPFGGNVSTPNAIITYTLTLNATGSGNLTDIVIADLIPAGTSYEAGSLRLNGSPLTDAADLDAGVFSGTGIQVSLPTVSAPTTQTVSFAVRIQ